jgi:hypothetical protein
MTTGWIIVNIALALGVTALVAGVAVLVPFHLDRRAIARDLHIVELAAVGAAQSQERQAA